MTLLLALTIKLNNSKFNWKNQ